MFKHSTSTNVNERFHTVIVIIAKSLPEHKGTLCQESDGYGYRYHYPSKGESHQVATDGSLIIWATLGGNYL